MGNAAAMSMESLSNLPPSQATQVLWELSPGSSAETIADPNASTAQKVVAGLAVFPLFKVLRGLGPLTKGAQEASAVLAVLSNGLGRAKVVNSADELEALFRYLSDGATPVAGAKYPGKFLQHADGTTIGLRAESRFGGAAIDIVFPDRTKARIHIDG